MKKNSSVRRHNSNRQAACRTAYAANASGAIIAKIAGISTAAVLAAAVPVILHNTNNSNNAAANDTVSQRADISYMNKDKNEITQGSVKKEEVICAAEEVSKAEEASGTEGTSSKAEVKETVKEADPQAIDGSHVFTYGGISRTFSELYNEGCANVSGKNDGRAMAIMQCDSAAGSAYYAAYFTVNNGSDWFEADTLRITNSTRQFFATDNGDILMFRYNGPDDHGVPYIQTITQGVDNKPCISDNVEILNGAVLSNSYVIHSSDNREELADIDYMASYNGGSTLHIDVSSAETGSILGSFDIDLNAQSYSFASNDASCAEVTESSSETSSGWKEAYKDFISNGDYRTLTQGFSNADTGELYTITDDNARFSLAYLDDDDIPELFVSGGMTVHILTYNGSEITQLITDDELGNVGWYGGVSIVEGKGLFLDDYQRMGIYSTPVYRMENGNAALLSDILYVQNFDEDGNSIDEFKINNMEVSRDEYLAELNVYHLNTYFTQNDPEATIADDNWTYINTYNGYSVYDVISYIDNF